MTINGNVLVVDDDDATCELVQAVLERQGYSVATRTSARAALDLLGEQDFDAVLTDLDMTEMNGLELCQRIAGARPNLPVIVVTGLSSMESAIGAMRAGAFDFVTKPIDADLLGLGVARAVRNKKLYAEVKRLRESSGGAPAVGMVGRSPAMQRVYDLVGRVARSDASVLVHGETGTGKELVARAIHDASERSGAFVAVNCAAVPPALLESELFGHARGAFTDAKSQRTGLFVEANGGTIFLDEIGELPLEVQPKLLRALQERKVRPVGANVEVAFDARLVTATNRDLETEVHERRFREDLFYRINVVKLDVPALRERGTDVLHLATHFLERFAQRGGKGSLSLSTAAAEKLVAYAWPGNVRELENGIERAVALTRFDQITVDDLPDKVKSYVPERFVVAVDELAEVLTMDELERRYIRRVLALVNGNKSRAAEVLGFDRRTLYRKLERYEEEARGAASSTPAVPRLSSERS